MVGIYKITSPSGRVYIGQSWNIRGRWNSHKSFKRPTNKFTTPLHTSFTKYGAKNHSYEIIHELPKDISQDILNTYENLYIEFYKQCGAKVMNLKEGGSKGKHSEESKKRMSESNKGHIAWNKGLKGVMVAWNKGISGVIKYSSETKLKQSLAKKGKLPNNTGTKRSQKAIDKTTLANAGKKRTPDQIKRISESLKGKPYHGKNNGKVRTPEMKKRISEAGKARITNKGESHAMSKFSNSIVLEIRLKYKTGKYTSRVLAQEYSMSKTNILDIVHHRIWQNI